MNRIYLLGSICGLFEVGRGKSVGGEEEQGQDEEHGGRVDGDGGDDDEGCVDGGEFRKKCSQERYLAQFLSRLMLITYLYCLFS